MVFAGVVTVLGEVDSFDERRRVVEAVTRVHGVRAVTQERAVRRPVAASRWVPQR
jgi:osmotically-inducible protein OsmY